MINIYILVILSIVILLFFINSQNLFKINIITFIYDYGYRKGFKIFGFPGYKKEIKNANVWFSSKINKNNKLVNYKLLDICCGTGISTIYFYLVCSLVLFWAYNLLDKKLTQQRHKPLNNNYHKLGLLNSDI